MNKDLLILAIIANAANPFTLNDKAKLEAMDESTLVNALCVPQTEEMARNALTDYGFDFDGYAVYQANEEGFKAYQAEQQEKRGGLIDEIVANSDFTAEMLKDKGFDELDILAKTFDKSIDRGAQGGSKQAANNSQSEQAKPACDYS